MTNQKENTATVQKQLNSLRKQIATEREAKDWGIMQAATSLHQDGCVLNTRRLFFDMCLQYSGDPKNGVDDHDRLTMLTMFEVLNVM